MNPNNKNPQNADDNLFVFLKGAPDRVLPRCSSILVHGEPHELTAAHRKEVLDANELFGNMGERVLGFSRARLDPADFGKEKLYDTKNWKDWKDIKDFASAANYPGWFPMWGLEFVGLVSLNDPPRKGVDLSVLKCKQAGIKVIMVTGDQ